jgi:hypothetical protein
MLMACSILTSVFLLYPLYCNLIISQKRIDSNLIPPKKYLIIIGIFAIIVSFSLLIPPFLRDDMIYHLAVPKLIASNGVSLPDFFNINANFPMLFEMLLVPVIKYGKGIISPFVVNYLLFIILIICVYSFVKRHTICNNTLALTIALCVGITPVLFEQIHSCYVEILFTILIIAGFSEYLEYRKNPSIKLHWINAAVLIGLSCAVKYFGLVYFSFLMLYEFIKGKNRKLFYAGLCLSILVCLPWYLKNYILSGNPFFPMLSNFFPSEYLSYIRARHFESLANSYHYGKTIVDYILLPFRIVIGYEALPKAGLLGFGGALSLFFGFAAFVSFKKESNRIVSALFLVYFVLWSLTSQQVRFLLPVAIMASIFGIGRAYELFKKRTKILYIVICLASVQSIVAISKDMQRNQIWPYLSGIITKDTFLRHHMSYSYDAAMFANKYLNRSTDKILTIGIFGRTYYFDIPALTNTYYDEEPFDMAFLKDSVMIEKIDLFLNKNNITHLLINKTFFFSKERLLFPIDFVAMQHYLDSTTEPIYQNGPLVILKRKHLIP